MSKIIYKYHKQIDNSLHKAAFRGKVDKINSLLNDFSPYKATSESETPLHLALSTGHLDAANIFLTILEIDLTAAKEFLRDHQLDIGVDNENFPCAIGIRQIDMLKRRCSEMIVNGTDDGAFEKCSFVLLKENILSVPSVLAIRPNNQEQMFVLLATVSHLLNENGVISLNVQRSSDRSTVLHCAAARGYTDTVARLLNLGMEITPLTHQVISHFLFLSDLLRRESLLKGRSSSDCNWCRSFNGRISYLCGNVSTSPLRHVCYEKFA